MASQTFEYESDWVEYFNEVLKNEIREQIDNRYLIKGSVVETNQSLDAFLKRNKKFVTNIPSREKFFHNLKIITQSRGKNREHFFYLNNSNERFWIIHNIEESKTVQDIINQLTKDNYLQDKIYLPGYTLENYQEKFDTKSMGFTLNFDQLFTLSEDNPVFEKEIDDFEDINFTLQLWPRRKKSVKFFLEKFRNINCPINYKSLNFIFEDEDNNLLVKEDLTHEGSTTIKMGRDFRRHLKFINGIREDYGEKIENIEDYRVDWSKVKGGLFTIEFNKEINPKNFMNLLNMKRIGGYDNPFKINAFYMYQEDNYVMYNCIDLHTGGQFYLQVFPTKLNVNLSKDSCGNIILRLFTNLQRNFSISVSLYIDGKKYQV